MQQAKYDLWNLVVEMSQAECEYLNQNCLSPKRGADVAFAG